MVFLHVASFFLRLCFRVLPQYGLCDLFHPAAKLTATTTKGMSMKKHIVFGLATAITLLLCLLFGNENTYRIASILLIFPVVLAVVFYRKRGLVYAALILLVSLLIPVFLFSTRQICSDSHKHRTASTARLTGSDALFRHM